MTQEEKFFDFAAEVGLTKHIGSIEATNRLADLCQITADSFILDVGCGVGITPCYLARTYGCRVVGVDILEKMVERSRERAMKAGLADQVKFRVADAQELPFEDELFDAVITESVTALTKNIPQAVSEYTRVTVPGGFVGLNESTWLKVPPPQEMIAWVKQDVGSSAEPLSTAAWKEVLINAGLQDIVVTVKPVDIRGETRGLVRRYGIGGMLKIMCRILRLYLRNPNYRQFVKEVSQGGVIPTNITEYFGYGLFVGSKGKRTS